MVTESLFNGDVAVGNDFVPHGVFFKHFLGKLSRAATAWIKTKLGFDPGGGSSAEFAKKMIEESAVWKKVITDGNITIEK